MPCLHAWEYGYYDPERYAITEKLADIEKALDYLDGGLSGAVGMGDKLKDARAMHQTAKIPLKYFDVTFYKKGTAHITFTNQAVLDKFNLYTARHKGWLPPSYGHKHYYDMDDSEKKVVDSFEGWKHYEVVMTETSFYLSEPVPLQIGAAIAPDTKSGGDT
ncbi:hypothetical protein FACS1894184_19370 [Clostridia bacterium]|nr:hypothetical protein FACS1894184_19370 [Clostridia bacterium]